VLTSAGEWLMIAGSCDVHSRLLCYREFISGVCWWCHPEQRPADFERHLEEVRKRARAKQSRGTKRPVQRTDDADEVGEDPLEEEITHAAPD
jgi:hypothetical protein